MQWYDGIMDESSIWCNGIETVIVVDWKGEGTTKGVGGLGCS
jgi:hypothetical protein